MTDMRADSIAPVNHEVTSEDRERRDEPSGALIVILFAFLVVTGTLFAFGIYHLTAIN
jgi:hypothetical protein